MLYGFAVNHFRKQVNLKSAHFSIIFGPRTLQFNTKSKKQAEAQRFYFFELNITDMNFKLSLRLLPLLQASKDVFEKLHKHFGTTLRQHFHPNLLSFKLYF